MAQEFEVTTDNEVNYTAKTLSSVWPIDWVSQLSSSYGCACRNGGGFHDQEGFEHLMKHNVVF